MFNTLPINPAYTGSREHLTATSVFRKQWTNIDGGPFTFTLSAHTPLKKNNWALGFTAIHDNIATQSKTQFYGVGSYRIALKNNSKLSFGMQLGYLQSRFYDSDLQTRLPNDPAVSNNNISIGSLGLGAGLYWYSKNYFLGFSIPDLLDTRPKINTLRFSNYFLHGGYVFKISDQVKYMPSSLIKWTNHLVPQLDINNVFVLNEVLWLGVSLRGKSWVNVLFQARVTSQINIGYSYDFPTNNLSKTVGASHEIKLSYQFVYAKEGAYMPRYF